MINKLLGLVFKRYEVTSTPKEVVIYGFSPKEINDDKEIN